MSQQLNWIFNIKSNLRDLKEMIWSLNKLKIFKRKSKF